VSLKTETLKLRDRTGELTFRLTEWPVLRRERFLIKAAGFIASAAGKDSGKILSELRGAGEGELLEVFVAGLGGLDTARADELLADMLKGTVRMVDGREAGEVNPDTLDGYVEELGTLERLRYGILKLNYGFFLGALAAPSSSPGSESGEGPAPKGPMIFRTTRT
jgi:hypothetical protein